MYKVKKKISKKIILCVTYWNVYISLNIYAVSNINLTRNLKHVYKRWNKHDGRNRNITIFLVVVYTTYIANFIVVFALFRCPPELVPLPDTLLLSNNVLYRVPIKVASVTVELYTNHNQVGLNSCHFSVACPMFLGRYIALHRAQDLSRPFVWSKIIFFNL